MLSMMAFVMLLGKADLERFAAPEAAEKTVTVEAESGPNLTMEMIRPHLPLIPPIEADVVELLLLGKTEYEVASIFGMSQAGISYKWLRGGQRLRWLISVEPIRLDEEELREVLTEELLREACRRGGLRSRARYSILELVIGMAVTTCLSEAARRAGAGWFIAQRHWASILRGLAVQREDERLGRVVAYLEAVDASRGILWASPCGRPGRRTPWAKGRPKRS